MKKRRKRESESAGLFLVTVRANAAGKGEAIISLNIHKFITRETEKSDGIFIHGPLPPLLLVETYKILAYLVVVGPHSYGTNTSPPHSESKLPECNFSKLLKFFFCLFCSKENYLMIKKMKKINLRYRNFRTLIKDLIVQVKYYIHTRE